MSVSAVRAWLGALFAVAVLGLNTPASAQSGVYVDPSRVGLNALQPFPYPDDVCQELGHSVATAAMERPDAHLIGCPAHEYGAIGDRQREGAKMVGRVESWSILSIPNPDYRPEVRFSAPKMRPRPYLEVILDLRRTGARELLLESVALRTSSPVQTPDILKIFYKKQQAIENRAQSHPNYKLNPLGNQVVAVLLLQAEAILTGKARTRDQARDLMNFVLMTLPADTAEGLAYSIILVAGASELAFFEESAPELLEARTLFEGLREHKGHEQILDAQELIEALMTRTYRELSLKV